MEAQTHTSALRRKGIRTTRGGTLQIPPGALVLSIGDDGAPEGEVREVLLGVSIWPDWLEIADRRLMAAQDARSRLEQADASDDDNAIGLALQAELQESISCISASVFALEAFVSQLTTVVRPITRSPGHEKPAQRAFRVISSASAIPAEPAEVLRSNIALAYTLRDQAVHPVTKIEMPAVHPVIDQAVPQFVANHRLENARGCLATSVEAIMRVADRPLASVPGLHEQALGWSLLVHEVSRGQLSGP